jgi:branched-chain amino acid transport system substrate-binding protein
VSVCAPLLALLLATAGALGSEVPAASAKLVIGLLLPPEEAQAASIREGVSLAVAQANQAATGQVQLVVRGRVGQWGADAVEAARMATDDGALGLIAPPDGAASHLSLQIAGRTATPVISLCADSSVSQTGVPWMVRVVPRTIEEAQSLFAGLAAANSAEPKRWMALAPDGRAGREIARDLNEAASNAGCTLEPMLEVKSTVTNFESICEQVLSRKPDVVLLWLDPLPAGTVVKALRQASYRGILAGPGRLRSATFAAAAGNASEGFITPSLVPEKNSQALFESFRAAFRKRFSREPDPMAAMSFDAATLLIHILRQTDAARLPRAFPLAGSLPGVSGTLRFDAQGNRQVTLQLLAAHQGRFVPAQK